MHPIYIGVNTTALLGNYRTVNGHPSLLNQLLGLSTCTDSTLSQKFLQSNPSFRVPFFNVRVPYFNVIVFSIEFSKSWLLAPAVLLWLLL
jgi:hypothetical protein